MIEEPHRRELIDLSTSARILGVSSDHVRTLMRRGYLAKAGERPSRSRHTPAILVRRADVERLADEGWPGRIRPRGADGAPPGTGAAADRAAVARQAASAVVPVSSSNATQAGHTPSQPSSPHSSHQVSASNRSMGDDRPGPAPA